MTATKPLDEIVLTDDEDLAAFLKDAERKLVRLEQVGGRSSRADHMLVFHGTGFDRADPIRRDGLIRLSPRGGPYFAEDPRYAFLFAIRDLWRTEAPGRGIVYAVVIPRDGLRPHVRDGVRHGLLVWESVERSVPPSMLRAREVFDIPAELNGAVAEPFTRGFTAGLGSLTGAALAGVTAAAHHAIVTATGSALTRKH